MAITFGNDAQSSGATPSFNNTGDLLLFGVSSTANTVSAITYNSVGMTQVGTAQNNVTAGRFISLWYLTGAAQGTNSFSITGGANLDDRALGINGENSVTPFTGTTTNTGTSASPSLALTTTVNNAYAIGLQFSGNTATAGANTTAFASTDYFGFFRSTNPITSAGSFTLNASITSTEWVIKGFGVNPPVVSTNANFLTFM